jgi:hypothetical protein
MPIVLNGTGGTISGVPGQVLQAVSTTINSETSTSSSSFVSTGTTATITPSSTSSKILVVVTGGLFWQSGTGGGVATIYRNGSNIHPIGNYFVRTYPAYSTSLRLQTTGSMSYLHSPATTSACAYTVYISTNGWGGTIQWGSSDNDCATITLMEIAA